MPHSLAIDDLKFRWSNNPNFELKIPKWQVKTNQKVFLYGRSGEGKSTLLNLIAGIHSQYSGQIQVLGQNLSDLNQRQRDSFRANNIGVIFQQFNLLPYLTGQQNILLANGFRTAQPSHLDTYFTQICDSLELSPVLLAQKANQLSVGQQQRVAVARALIGQPKLIIADEPTSALDSHARENFIHLLLDAAKSASVIFVSHDLSLAEYFDQKVHLADLQSHCSTKG
ncbi:ABC transporter ATP-binding protein [Paraglaciecola aestuariivivens]